MKADITVIILTYNEAKHIERCIQSTLSFATKVLVIDSYSDDETVTLSKNLGATVYCHEFLNHASQLNWAFDHCQVNTQWILRLDADEIVTPEFATAMNVSLTQIPIEVSGLTVNRQIHFLGKWIKRGGIYPIAPLRVWRSGKGRCENRWMDEHIIVEGKVGHLKGDIADINLNNLTWWTAKHNDYASREAIELLLMKQAKKNSVSTVSTVSTGLQATYKRWIKENIYAKLPLGIRAFSYFIYRYIFLLGFLDGWRGLAFHSLQGLWYRFLVDLKVYELEQLMKQRNHTLVEVVKAEFGYELEIVEGA